jgi:hypothetical protein
MYLAMGHDCYIYDLGSRSLYFVYGSVPARVRLFVRVSLKFSRARYGFCGVSFPFPRHPPPRPSTRTCGGICVIIPLVTHLITLMWQLTGVTRPFGSRNKKRKAPRAVWYGITFVKYALHM